MSTLDFILDKIWFFIAQIFSAIGHGLYNLTSFFHPLGPAMTISLIAFATVCLTKLLNKLFITRRYKELEANFNHWRSLREEATSFEDKEVGQRMARNIDQAELNKAYYDYFFEGLLLGMGRRIIPIFFIFAFVNEFYRPEQLEALFGQNYALALPGSSDQPLLLGAIFWYITSLLGWYLLWHFARKLLPCPSERSGSE